VSRQRYSSRTHAIAVATDANFDETSVNAHILRLTKARTRRIALALPLCAPAPALSGGRRAQEEEWIRESVANMGSFVQGEPKTFLDSIFENDMNACVSVATAAYDRMLFHDALVAGHYELLNARDRYRVNVGGEKGMNAKLVQRFIELYLVMLSPVSPHITQELWEVIGKVRRPGARCRWLAGWRALPLTRHGAAAHSPG
jgi:leucyl-tRNA synthetase